MVRDDHLGERIVAAHDTEAKAAQDDDAFLTGELGNLLILWHRTRNRTARGAEYNRSHLNPNPRSFRLTKRLRPMTRWSSTSMSSRRPASTIISVTRTSSGLGVGSPLG